MTRRRRAVLVAPFWGQPGHVGVYRAERMVRWMARRGVEVVVVRAGGRDAAADETWGTVITVRDPLGLYPDAGEQPTPVASARRPSKLRRAAAMLLFVPDPSVVWARRAARDPRVLTAARSAVAVLGSSPPESTHLASSRIAAAVGARLIVDLRDGWLDEPLRRELRYRWRRLLEGRIERRIVAQADQVFVTSDAWKRLLTGRYPSAAERTTVLTNGYPPAAYPRRSPALNDEARRPMLLLHAGRFSGSSAGRRAGQLLAILYPELPSAGPGGVVRLIGGLSADDAAEIEHWSAPFGAKGWQIQAMPPVPRAEILQQMVDADGLLLFSPSHAAIPSKLFEYLPAARPVLAVTERGSAVWEILSPLEQAYVVDVAGASGAGSVAEFLAACRASGTVHACPPEFAEDALAERFWARLAGAFDGIDAAGG